jgi:hypothetical protein
MTGLQLAAWGAFGSAIFELIQVAQAVRGRRRPRWLSSWLYWLVGLMNVVLGAFLSLLLLEGQSTSPITAFYIGASFPVFLSYLARLTPSPSAGTIAAEDLSVNEGLSAFLDASENRDRRNPE